MKILDCVATNVDQYIAIAARLGVDLDFRREVSEKLRHRRDLMFEDQQVVSEWERFLEMAVGGVSSLPQDYQAQISKANADGELDKAKRLLLLALDRFPNDSRLHNDLGAIYYQLSKHPEALRHFQLALQLDPNNVQANNNIGVAFRLAGDLEKALDAFSRAYQLDDENPNAALFNVVNTLRTMRDYDRIVDEYQKLIGIDVNLETFSQYVALALVDLHSSAFSVETKAIVDTLRQSMESLNVVGIALQHKSETRELWESNIHLYHEIPFESKFPTQETGIQVARPLHLIVQYYLTSDTERQSRRSTIR